MTLGPPPWSGPNAEAVALADAAVKVAEQGGDVEAYLRDWCDEQRQAQVVDSVPPHGGAT